MNTSPLIVGLTGGIGSGKTAASNCFAHHGIKVIDADVIAREALAKDSPLLKAVYNHFGNKLANTDGSLDRAALRERIFSHPDDKRWLEKKIHPYVREKIVAGIQSCQDAYLILSSPLLIESHQDQLVDRILVVDVPESVQIERTCQRDGNSHTLVQAIMQTQISRKERLAKADDILDNSQGLEALEKAVSCWHAFYRQLARSRP